MQKKIYSILSGDSALSDLIQGVFDSVPDNTDRAYIVIGEDDFQDWSSHAHDGFLGDVTIHVWSEARGQKEVKTIQNRLYELLQNVDLGLTGFKTINFRLDLCEVLKDPDGRTQHGIIRFNFLLGGN